jgi:mannose-binding lectin 2
VFTEVSIHYADWDQWESCFKLGNLTVPASPYVGITAATGDVSDNHDVISITTTSIVYKDMTKKEKEQLRAHHLGDGKAGKKGRKWLSYKSASKDSGGHAYNGNAGPGLFARAFGSLFSLLWMLFKVAAVLGIIGAAAYIFMKRKKKLDAKRF